MANTQLPGFNIADPSQKIQYMNILDRITSYLGNNRSFIVAQCRFRLYFHLPPCAPVPSRKAISGGSEKQKNTRECGGSAGNDIKKPK